MVVVALLAARPQYRKKRLPRTLEPSVGGNLAAGGKTSSFSADAPAMLVPSLAHSRSVRETIQEVKMVQVCMYIMLRIQNFHCLCYYL